EQEYVHWKRYQVPLSLIVIDIDYFKKINDNYGHMAGDKVLQTLAKLIQNNVRETDLLTRYGGEEFAIIMPDTDQEAAIGVAEKLRIETENCAFHYRDTRVNITISCGITEFKDKNKDNPETVFERADAALYKAKDAGRNCCIPG
ncbi:MAG: GGDEF domain-containing protein, partial [Gammaproteobacteria bacterium]|nr:GGDEF domain-containing protein [Gammaproteobacteria bacterium]